MTEVPFTQALLCGAFAGMAVDTVLYPLDTIRTRQQSAQGFWKAGGFKGVYNGISAAFAGSAPSAALFFSAYETSKNTIQVNSSIGASASEIAGAAIGEVFACITRVPTENVKQNIQVGQYNKLSEALAAIQHERGFAGFFRGYWTTVLRDSPFAMIQFPIWESLKRTGRKLKGDELSNFEKSCCGAMAGSSTAFLTCPLDVIKTRIMLGKDLKGVEYKGFVNTGMRIAQDEGVSTLFKGVIPRTAMIGVGGFVFLGGYDFAKAKTDSLFSNKN